jgi:hypothetical protein
MSVGRPYTGVRMTIGTHNPGLMGFPGIRRWVWIEFYIHMFVSGANFVPIRFVGPGLILLNPDPIHVVRGLKLK